MNIFSWCSSILGLELVLFFIFCFYLIQIFTFIKSGKQTGKQWNGKANFYTICIRNLYMSHLCECEYVLKLQNNMWCERARIPFDLMVNTLLTPRRSLWMFRRKWNEEKNPMSNAVNSIVIRPLILYLCICRKCRQIVFGDFSVCKCGVRMKNNSI